MNEVMSESSPSRLRRLAVPVMLLGPALVLIGLAMAPVIAGAETFFYRDISHFHLHAKWSQMQSWSQGRLPLIDMARGGAVSLGNPNTVPLYPTNLLYAVAPFYWAFNAHFWLHLLLAPLGVYWLARVWGLGRPGACCAGVVYALSGYYLSQFGFYNLVGGATLAPALVAATLGSSRVLRRDVPARRWPPLLAVGVLWALVLLAGDPIVALQAGLLGLGAVVIDRWPSAAASPGEAGEGGGRWRKIGTSMRGLPWLAASTIAGTLVALPQYVEMARILPYSYRFQIFTPRQALLASWDPRQVAEWLIPFFFGRPQLNFWGHRFSGDEIPLFFSLFPGVLALALVLVSGRPRTRAHAFGWIGVVAGLAVALGSFNPLVHLLVRLPGIQLLRFPIKFWLPIAMGAALLVGLGFERCRDPGARRQLLRVLGLLMLLYVAFSALLVQFPAGVERWVTSVFTQPQPPNRAHEIRMNWLALSLVQALLVGVYCGLVWWARRAPGRAAAAALTIHAASQLLLLRPLYATDTVAVYQQPPPLLAQVAEHEEIVHGELDELFGPADNRGIFPDGSAHWVERRGRLELYPFVGIQFGRRYVLLNSPEGLGSFFTVGAVQAMRLNGDDVRVRIARTAGADVVILKRRIEDPESLGLRLRAEGTDAFDSTISIYEIADSPPEFVLAGRVAYYERLDEVLQAIMSPQFDPLNTAIVPGPARQVARPSGEVEVVSSSADRIELVTRSPEGGVLVAQRVFLSLYRATIDGEPAPITVANLHRLGLEVPAGEHRVEIWVESAPFWRSLWGTGAGVLGLCAIPWLLGGPRRRDRTGAAGDGSPRAGSPIGVAIPATTAETAAVPTGGGEEYTLPASASARALDRDPREEAGETAQAEIAETE
ncbi:MAG TPA: hypothetical protein VMT85_05765 [Thermoanaerobaculia bacterium]|nr:hypothetical protein [Thermoanaerobaculia bacterium]